METFLKRSIKESYNCHYSNKSWTTDQTKPLDSIFLTSTSFIEIKQVIVWFFLISDCTVFKGKLKNLVDNVKRLNSTLLVTLLKIGSNTDYVILEEDIFDLALPERFNVLLANNEKTLLEIAYTINATNSGDNSTSTGRSESKRSKSSKVDMNNLNHMVEYIYNCNLSTRSEDISPYLERMDDGSYLLLEEESRLINSIHDNLQQMVQSGMRFKTYRYYQVLLSFINATSSLIKEFQYLKLDNEAFYQYQQSMENIDYFTELVLQQGQQQTTANEDYEGNEQGNEQGNNDNKLVIC